VNKLLAVLVAVSLTTQAVADEIDYGGFESWQQSRADQPAAPPASKASAPDSKAASSRPAAAKKLDSGARAENRPVQAGFDPIIRFGAGATYLMSVRTADLASGRKVLSEFSGSVRPFRSIFELGFDLALARDGSFFARPNMKLFLMRNVHNSLYLEGSLAIYSHPDGVEVGGGAGIGAVVGIIDNLGIEIFASAMMFNMSAAAADNLVTGGIGDMTGGGAGFILMPYLGARLVARF